MKKTLKTLVATAAVAAGLATGAAQAQERVFFGIATGGTGGTYYPLGGMLAQVLSNNTELDGKKLSATAETGNASVANAGLLGRGAIESAFVAADVLDAAYTGKNQFEGKPLKNLRALGALYPETVQLVTQPGIAKFEDLKGKSVSSGSPGSGQWQLLGDLLASHGMKREDITEDYSSFSQSVEKIKDGHLDASLITAGSPTASVVELSNGHDINIVPLSGPAIAKLQETQPYYANTVLKAGTYKGVDKDVETLAVRAIWTTHADLPEDIAYAVTKALYENTETLGKVHVKGKEISVETALESVSIPLHKGAERYFREKALSSKLKLLFGAVAFMAAAPNVYGAALDITDSRSNEKLACIELAEDEFALTFIHSVSLTPVEDIYKIYKVSPDAFAIRQLEERFITHGQGLPSMDGEPDAKRFVRQDGTFILYLDRPINDLIVRLDSRFKNRLDVGSSVINLNQWPDFSGVRLTPVKDCH